MKLKICASYLKSKYDLSTTIDKLNNSLCDYIHIDVMDGEFVNNKTYDINTIINSFRMNNKPLDVHLMVKNVKKYIIEYADLLPEYITFHLEIDEDINEIIDIIHSYNIKCGISIKPNTDINKLKPYLDKIDLILIMSVEPGKGGQTFIPSTIDKLKKLRKINKKILISVDGGINNETIKDIKKYIDMAVSGSYICMKEDYNKQIINLKNS